MNAPIAPDFNFAELGIGGLDNEFQTIFRRAFASRVLPIEIFREFGVRHVKGTAAQPARRNAGPHSWSTKRDLAATGRAVDMRCVGHAGGDGMGWAAQRCQACCCLARPARARRSWPGRLDACCAHASPRLSTVRLQRHWRAPPYGAATCPPNARAAVRSRRRGALTTPRPGNPQQVRRPVRRKHPQPVCRS